MPAMKVKPEHIEKLRTYIHPFLSKEEAEAYAAHGLSPMRYRWDAFWRAKQKNKTEMQELIDELYTYVNDDHIDTVLRMLANERKDVSVPRGAVKK